MNQLKDQMKNEINQVIENIKGEITSIKNQLNHIQNENEIRNEINQRNEEITKHFESLIAENNLKQQKKINQFKQIIINLNLSDQFINECSLEEFNAFDGELQTIIFNTIYDKNKNETTTNIHNLLTFLSVEKQKAIQNYADSNFIYLHSKDKLSNLRNIDSIGISSNATQTLFENGNLNSIQFYNLLSKFNDLCIEIQYPSDNYQRMIECVIQMKKNQIPKVKIVIFVSGIAETDANFKNNKDINIVKIGPSVKVIKGGFNQGSFENCVLEELTIPPSVASIEKCAFQKCVNLKKLTINPYKTRIDANAFNSCPSLDCLVFHSSVDEIKPFNFDQFWNLKEIIMLNSVKSIKENSFDQCLSLEKITISESVPSIEASLFTKNIKHLQIIITQNKTKYSNQAFQIYRINNGQYILKKMQNVQKIPFSVNNCGQNIQKNAQKEQFSVKYSNLNVQLNKVSPPLERKLPTAEEIQKGVLAYRKP